MTKIQIKGMTCNHCKMRVEKALKQAGCGKVKVELETGNRNCGEHAVCRRSRFEKR